MTSDRSDCQPGASSAQPRSSEQPSDESCQVDPLTITIEPDELLGLAAVAQMRRTADDGQADVASTGRQLLRGALQARLDELGLPWAPSAEMVAHHAAKAAKPDTGLRAVMRGKRARRYALSILLTATLVLLWGGYVRDWSWTGFSGNGQLWDWLRLLLLPVVIGTAPLWLQHSEYISRGKHLAYALGLLAFGGFVAAGYLVPLGWTGFQGNTLWDWFVLLLLPLAVASVPVLSSVMRSLRPYHKGAITVIFAGWALTVVGGYGLGWRWTGYQGNTLWDWLGLLLLPLIVPAILVPRALKWASGDGAERVQQARARAVTGAKARPDRAA